MIIVIIHQKINNSNDKLIFFTFYSMNIFFYFFFEFVFAISKIDDILIFLGYETHKKMNLEKILFFYNISLAFMFYV